MFLVNVLSGNDAINQLCAVIMPPIFLYVGLVHFFGEKLANLLLRKDSYNEKRIKVRIYGIFRVTVTCLFLAFLIVYFSLYKIWYLAIFFVVTLLGYTWIKFRTYFARLKYTNRYITFYTGKKQDTFSWEDVMEVSWEIPNKSTSYALRIRFISGLTTKLLSSDFVGLNKLKAFYDEGHYKN